MSDFEQAAQKALSAMWPMWKYKRAAYAAQLAKECAPEMCLPLLCAALRYWRLGFTEALSHDEQYHWNKYDRTDDIQQLVAALSPRIDALSGSESLDLCRASIAALEPLGGANRWTIHWMLGQFTLPCVLTELLTRALQGRKIEGELRLQLESWDEVLSTWNGAYQAQRQAIDLLLGEIPRLPALGAPWADALRDDLVAMNEAQRAAWGALLTHARHSESASPTKKWLREAETLLDALETGAFIAHFERWLELAARGTEPLEGARAEFLKGLIWCAALGHSPVRARVVARFAAACWKKVPGVAARSARLGNACLWSLGAMPEGAEQLAQLSAAVKTSTAQKAVAKALGAAATRAGLTPEELAEMALGTFGMKQPGVLQQRLAGYTATVDFNLVRSGVWSWTAPDGKTQKTTPEIVKRETASELKALKNTVADIPKALTAQRDCLEKLLVLDKTWPLAVWRERYLNHPLMALLTRRQIWRFESESGTSDGIWHEGALCDFHGQALSVPENAVVRLWHALLDSAENVAAWRRFIEGNAVAQPFKQAHREIYVLTEAERQTGVYSNRFAAHILRQHQFRALCQARGWHYALQVGDSLNYAEIELPQARLTAQFFVDVVAEQMSEAGVWLYVATDRVRFLDAAGEPLSLEASPPLIFSEIMRDVDLFVGVASVGNDPTWNDGGPQGRFVRYWNDYSFGDLSQTAQTRRDLLSRLLPKLKIAALCELQERFLRVRGTLRTYKIHLGSGNILMEPNDQYLCIVPSRDSRSEPIFLPFEGDQTLSVILSKAFLLAADDKITDATITRQIK